MNNESMFELLSDLDEQYIEEAGGSMGKNRGMLRFIAVAASFLVLLGGLFLRENGSRSKITGVSLHALAAEIGQESVLLGAAMPQILNVTDGNVIMYDYIGIWVYDTNEQELKGFCDFKKLNMTRTQGDPCVLVGASQDGKRVKFYWTDGSANYLYDVSKNDYRNVEQYDEEDWSFNFRLAEDKKLSNCCETYILEDGTYIAYDFDYGDGSEELKYGDLLIVMEKDGVRTTYRPFPVK